MQLGGFRGLERGTAGHGRNDRHVGVWDRRECGGGGGGGRRRRGRRARVRFFRHGRKVNWVRGGALDNPGVSGHVRGHGREGCGVRAQSVTTRRRLGAAAKGERLGPRRGVVNIFAICRFFHVGKLFGHTNATGNSISVPAGTRGFAAVVFEHQFAREGRESSRSRVKPQWRRTLRLESVSGLTRRSRRARASRVVRASRRPGSPLAERANAPPPARAPRTSSARETGTTSTTTSSPSA